MATLNIKGFPDGLHRRLKARAKRNRRSVAQEVTQMLADLIDDGKPLPSQELEGGDGAPGGRGGSKPPRPPAPD
jgi:plasmid stability protein